MQKTHWKKLDNPDYLGAYAINPGEELTLTINTVGVEMVVGADGKKEECKVMRFMENVKPLILNNTNAKTIAKLLGTPYIEDWNGHRITLHSKKVKAFGELVDAIRVKEKLPAPLREEPPIICQDCGKPITAVGSNTAKKIAERSLAVFGVNLCMTCAQKRKEAQSKEAEQSNAE